MKTTVILLFLAFVTPAAAQVVVSGQVQHPTTLTADDLAKLPTVTVHVDFATEHGRSQATYTGPLLWTVLERAGLVDAPGGRTHLQHSLLARGSDGYAVALAIGEIDPGFENKQVIIGTASEGKPVGLRLVMPGDAKGGRNVRDLVAIEVR